MDHPLKNQLKLETLISPSKFEEMLPTHENPIEALGQLSDLSTLTEASLKPVIEATEAELRRNTERAIEAERQRHALAHLGETRPEYQPALQDRKVAEALYELFKNNPSAKVMATNQIPPTVPPAPKTSNTPAPAKPKTDFHAASVPHVEAEPKLPPLTPRRPAKGSLPVFQAPAYPVKEPRK